MDMQITRHKPAVRGVSQLMYVGDVDDRPMVINVGPLAIAALLAWLILRKR